MKSQKGKSVSKIRPSDERLFWFGLQVSLLVLSLSLVVGGILWAKRERVLQGNSDFTSIYTALRIVHDRPATLLYDLNVQRETQRQILGGYSLAKGLLPFIHFPFELWLLFPLGWFHYRQAMLIWTGVNLVMLGILFEIVVRTNARAIVQRKGMLLLALTSFYPFLVCLWQGQVSILLGCLLGAVLYCLLTQRPLLAGFLLSLTFVKPHTFYLFLVAMVFGRKWKAVVACVVSIAVLMGGSWYWVGSSGLRELIHLLSEMNVNHQQFGNPLGKMHTWTGQLYLSGGTIFESSLAKMVIITFAVFLTAVLWRSHRIGDPAQLRLRFAATILVAVLGSPHLFLHDLSLVFLVLCLSAGYLLEHWGGGQRQLGWLGLLFVSPWVWVVSLPLSEQTGIQISVLWMTVLLGILVREIGGLPNGETPNAN